MHSIYYLLFANFLTRITYNIKIKFFCKKMQRFIFLLCIFIDFLVYVCIEFKFEYSLKNLFRKSLKQQSEKSPHLNLSQKQACIHQLTN